jgi:hypothetical protein
VGCWLRACAARSRAPACGRTLCRSRALAAPQLASRAARGEAAPSYLLRLLSAPPGAAEGAPAEAQLLCCDHATLRALSQGVDAALRAADAAHARRLRRYLK